MGQFFDDETIKILEESFGKDEIKSRRGVGVDYFYYISLESIVERLNKAFGHGWMFEVREHKEIDDQILVLGRLTVRDKSNNIIFRDAFGSAPIQRFGEKSSNAGKRLDAANDYKSASADSLKKISSTFGIGVKDIQDAITSHGSGFYSNERAAPVNANRPSSFFNAKPAPAQNTTPAQQPNMQPVQQPDPNPVQKIKPKASTFPSGSVKLFQPKPQPEQQVKPASTFPVTTKTQTAQPVVSAAPGQMPVKTAPNPFEANTPKNNFVSSLMSDSPSSIKFSQRDAITTICRTKGVIEANLILNTATAFDNKVLANKATVDSLTSEEATLVIRYANTLPDIRRVV